jgi:MFS family permease
MAIPAIAATMAIMFLRTATSGVQFSLYIVYLDHIGLTGTVIGLLFAAIEIASGFGSLAAGRAMRWGDPQKTMLSGTVASILFICATPFLGGIFLLLLLAQIGRGWLQGLVQPMMFSVQAKAVGRYRQGSVVGLRQTANRLSSIIIPPIMGVVADLWGLTESFVVLGVALLFICVPIARITRRASQAPAVEEAPRPG